MSDLTDLTVLVAELSEKDARIAALEAENERLTEWMRFAREQMSDAALREVDRRYIARNCKEMP